MTVQEEEKNKSMRCFVRKEEDVFEKQNNAGFTSKNIPDNSGW